MGLGRVTGAVGRGMFAGAAGTAVIIATLVHFGAVTAAGMTMLPANARRGPGLISLLVCSGSSAPVYSFGPFSGASLRGGI